MSSHSVSVLPRLSQRIELVLAGRGAVGVSVVPTGPGAGMPRTGAVCIVAGSNAMWHRRRNARALAADAGRS